MHFASQYVWTDWENGLEAPTKLYLAESPEHQRCLFSGTQSGDRQPSDSDGYTSNDHFKCISPVSTSGRIGKMGWRLPPNCIWQNRLSTNAAFLVVLRVVIDSQAIPTDTLPTIISNAFRQSVRLDGLGKWAGGSHQTVFGRIA